MMTRTPTGYCALPCLAWGVTLVVILCAYFFVTHKNDERTLFQPKSDLAGKLSRLRLKNTNMHREEPAAGMAELLHEIDRKYEDMAEMMKEVKESIDDQGKIAANLQHLHGHAELHEGAVTAEKLTNEQVLEALSKLDERLQSVIDAVPQNNLQLAPSVTNANSSDIVLANRVAPISLLIPCGDKHMHRIAQTIESIARQTILPNETIIVLSIDKNVEKELDYSNITRYKVPNLRIIVRGGLSFAGNNRQFLGAHAYHDVISFFDCDDFLHPQRTEAIYTIFKNNPTLEALVHGFKHFLRDDFALSKKAKFINSNSSFYVDMNEVQRFKPLWPYEELYNQPIIANDWNNRTWDFEDSLSEPNREKGNLWFFPAKMTLQPKIQNQPHNGWLSIRRDVFLSLMPYPDIPRGQDSLFNWRILKGQHNFTAAPYVLGAYLSRNPKGPNIY